MLINTKLSKDIVQGLLTEDQLKYIEMLEEYPLFATLVSHLENN
jgi:hypothetical protein